MAYSSIVKPSDYFNTKLYTGNGSSQSITGIGFKPDWIWQKERSGTSYHVATDVVRGNTKQLFPNVTATEATSSLYITSFDSDGFGQGQNNDTNESGQTYVAWNWKAGGGQGSSNTDGSINTTYTSVNTTAGFSISTYTGDNNGGATIGHGLGVIPSMVIVKKLSSTRDWMIKHKDLTSNYNIALNTSDAQWQPSSNGWISNLTSNQTIGFSIGSSDIDNVNQGGQTFVAYCFAEKQGYSKFGSYTGNGNANGTFVYTGFKPAWLMMKRSDGVNSWYIFDNKRNVFNVTNSRLKADDSVAESSNLNTVDFLSNGFKLTDNNDAWNYAGGTYIYMAFAENPLVANSGTDGVPATAK